MKKIRKHANPGRPLLWRHIFLLTFLFFLTSTLIGLWIINKKIHPTLVAYASSQTKNIATIVINSAVKDEIVVQNLSNILGKNSINDKTLEFDTQKVNTIVNKLTTTIQKNLQNIEDGDLAKIEKNTGLKLSKNKNNRIQFTAPLGVITQNAFLASRGPNIPIDLQMIGEVETDIEPKITPYGINNAFIEIIAVANVKMRIIIPFLTDTTNVTVNIPIALGTFEGEVPDFYNGLLPK